MKSPEAHEGAGSEAGTRVDKWLWGARIYKTRTGAAEACRAGHVRVNGAGAKPASLVRPGDVVSARAPSGDRVLEVLSLLEKRTGAAIAAASYIDRSPPRPKGAPPPLNFARERGAGRPTKRDRRLLGRVRGK